MQNSNRGLSESYYAARETPISPGFFQAIAAEKRSSPICSMKLSGIPRTLKTFKRAPPSDLSRRAQAIDFLNSNQILASPYVGLRTSVLLSCTTPPSINYSPASLTACDYSPVKLLRLNGMRRSYDPKPRPTPLSQRGVQMGLAA